MWSYWWGFHTRPWAQSAKCAAGHLLAPGWRSGRLFWFWMGQLYLMCTEENRKILNKQHKHAKWIITHSKIWCGCNTWLECLVIRAVGHIEPTQLDSNLITSGLAHCECHFDYIRLWFVQNFLCNRDVQSHLNVGDVDPQSHRPMGWERLAILIEQLRSTKKKSLF